MKVTAKLNYLHISPRKVRALVDLVRGLDVDMALSQLRFAANRSAEPLRKLIKSAVANAEHNLSLSADTLKIALFKVDDGPAFKRFRPNSRGRVSPLKKRTSHVTLVLEGERVSPSGQKQAAKKVKIEVSKNKPAETSQEKEILNAAVSESKKGVFKDKPIRKQSPGFVRRVFQRKAV